MGGVEPPTSSLPRMRSNHLSYMGALRRSSNQALERETGLEPATPSLEGLCSSQLSYSRPKLFCVCLRHANRLSWWRGEDSNLRRREPTGLQPVPFGRFGTSPEDDLRPRLLSLARQFELPAHISATQPKTKKSRPARTPSPRGAGTNPSLLCVTRALTGCHIATGDMECLWFERPLRRLRAELARGLEPPTC